MSFTQRQFATNVSSISSYDSPTLGASTYDVTADMSCNDIMMCILTAIKGVTGYIQGASNASGLGSFSSCSQAFTNPNTAGNCIVVDVTFDASFPLVSAYDPPFSPADTNGNSYQLASFGHVPGSGVFVGTFVAFNIAGDSLSPVTTNTVSVTFTGAGVPGSDVCIAVHEYAGAGMSLDNVGVGYVGGGPATAAVSVATSVTGDWLHLAIGISHACLGSPFHITGGIPQDWLVVNEPPSGSPATGGGLTRRGSFLFADGSKHEFTSRLRERGTASYTLVSDPTDPLSAPTDYLPTMGQLIYLFDQNADGYELEFTGLIQDFTVRWVGIGGLRYIDCTAVSLESVFDTVYAQPMQFVDQTCGFILTALFNAFENGCPVSLGTVQAGASINLFNAQLGDKLSDLFGQLATTSGFVWGVDPQTQQLYFQLPSVIAAPFTVESSNVLWDSISQKFDNADYRNRQAVKLSYDAFPHSQENFVGSGQTAFTLMRPVEQVTNCWVTTSTPNTATAHFSGQPSPGDTITIGPDQGAWQASHIYGSGGVITVGGYVFKVTVPGTSGGTIPNFASVPVLGDTIQDNTVIWTNQGPAGLGTGFNTYTFVASLDNTQFGQILIDTTLARTVQNTADALNARAAYGGPPATNGKGVTFSLPTWENSQVNAISVTSTGFTVAQKAPGTGWIAGLTTTSSNFSWSAAVTSGGTSPQTSVGPNEPATLSIAVYTAGTATSAPCLVYTPGSATVSLATPLNSGTNLSVEYTRTDGNVIEVEDTASVTALAAVSHGTGKYQQSTDQSSTGLIATSAAAGLQLAQEILATFDITQQKFSLDFYRPGILPGQVLTLDLNSPLSVMNGSYLVLSVKAQMVYKWPFLDSPGVPFGGHYKYTADLINVNLIGTDLAFWLGLGGGSTGGSGSAGALVATTGGAGSSTPGSALTTGGVNEQTGSYTATAQDNGKLISFNSAGATTLTLPASPPFPQWCIFVQNIAAGILTVSPNGNNLDGGSGSLNALKFQGFYITTDGMNYFTSRGVQPQRAISSTGSQAPAAAQWGVLYAFNSSSPLTCTLPATSPGLGWYIFVQCIGSGGVTIDPNGLTIDGSASSITLTQGQGIYIAASGTAYFTMRGRGTPGGSSGQIQYNNAGAFGGVSGATSSGTDLLVTTQASGDSSTKAASTAFVAAALSGINPAVAVQAATTAAGDTSGFTYNNGVSGVGATFTGSVNTAVTIDGFTFTTLGQRLLVKNDTQSPSGAFNGVYYVTQLQTSLLAPVLTRALDYDQPSDINNTGAIPVISGTVNGSTSWVLTSQVTTVGTSPLTYAQFSYNPSTLVQTSRNINTTAPLTGGGNLSADRTLAVSAATSGALGVVQPDGTIITVSGGAITVPKATSSAFGVVEVDGTTITASGGVISAPGASAGMVQIAQIVVGSPASNFSFTSIPQTYTNLVLTITCGFASSDSLKIQVNGDTANNYEYTYLQYSGGANYGTASSTNYWGSFLPVTQVTSQSATSMRLTIYGYTNTTNPTWAEMVQMYFAGSGSPSGVLLTNAYTGLAAITSIKVYTAGGANFVAGSVFTLYGMK